MRFVKTNQVEDLNPGRVFIEITSGRKFQRAINGIIQIVSDDDMDLSTVYSFYQFEERFPDSMFEVLYSCRVEVKTIYIE